MLGKTAEPWKLFHVQRKMTAAEPRAVMPMSKAAELQMMLATLG
jgi:hypothetical protein